MADKLPPVCDRCDGCGWLFWEAPGNIIDGVIHMRPRFNPCPACNADGKVHLGGRRDP